MQEQYEKLPCTPKEALLWMGDGGIAQDSYGYQYRLELAPPYVEFRYIDPENAAWSGRTKLAFAPTHKLVPIEKPKRTPMTLELIGKVCSFQINYPEWHFLRGLREYKKGYGWGNSDISCLQTALAFGFECWTEEQVEA